MADRYLLALETSAREGGAALLRNGELVRETTLGAGTRHGQLLLPTAQALLAEAGITVKDLSGIAVSVGPGGYTGIRIGVMAAKSLAWAQAVPLVAVSSLAAFAWTVRDLAGVIVPAMDARRDEVYTARYRIESDTPVAEMPDIALTPEEAAAYATGDGCAFVGSAVERYPEIFASALTAGTSQHTTPTSPAPSAVGTLGWQALLAAETVDPLALQPTYLRRDDAPPVFER